MSLENQFAEMLHSEFQQKKLEETMNELSVDELAGLLRNASAIPKEAMTAGFVSGMLRDATVKPKQIGKVIDGQKWTRTMSPKERLEKFRALADKRIKNLGPLSKDNPKSLSPEAQTRMRDAAFEGRGQAGARLERIGQQEALKLKAGLPKPAAQSPEKKKGFFSGLFKSSSAVPVEIADYWAREMAHSHMQKVAKGAGAGVGESIGSFARTLKGLDPHHRMLGGALVGLAANRMLNRDASLPGDVASLALGAAAGRGAPGALAQLRHIDTKGFGKGVRKGLRGVSAAKKSPEAPAPAASTPATP